MNEDQSQDQSYLGACSALEAQRRINFFKDALYGGAKRSRQGESVLEASHKSRGLRDRQHARKIGASS